ncbi:hypothetical protein H340_01284 [Streptomyces mobaraensis NBRC 13819 = DSM 40847]|uniref:Uncharacterized protein n=2 Tax=Streptomyces mobaraensis TaxID=35621 RepID=M3CEE8_STRM1|nr:hypothetical protein [Streptomyces mobaraensis]EMF02437.1 hypothetical protein H340_01284 [Streptomyces mobaraensis NBRC 13819 = DSM 40847]
MRLNEWSGTVLCSGCKMDLHAYPEDYEADITSDVYCGHCENEHHECEVPEPVAALLREALKLHRARMNDEYDDLNDHDDACVELVSQLAEYVLERREATAHN